jgi:hypothetical protein
MEFIGRNPILFLVGVPVALFLGMLAMLEIGRRIGLRRIARDPEAAKAGMGPLEGSVFGLLGLLLAFTFAGAAGRYDSRRDLVVQEANALGDAWARLDTLPAATQPAIRDGMRRYVEARLETYRRIPDLAAVRKELHRSVEIQDEVWKGAVAACATPEGQRVTMLVLPALDAAFDMTTIRTAKAMHHPPLFLFLLLFVLAFASALLAGYGMTGGKERNWMSMAGYAAATAIALYAVLDIEFPRIGLVRLDNEDRMLVEVLDSMK